MVSLSLIKPYHQDIFSNLDIQVQETLNSGDINVISFSFLWHRNATSLTNLDNEEICVGSDVGFSVLIH